MKKSVVLSAACLALVVASALGQGGIAFNTYTANHENGIQVTYGMGPLFGQGIDNTFTGVLLYSVSPIFENATTQGTQFTPLNPGWSVGSIGTFNVNCPAGYIAAPNFNYSGTAGTTLYFEVAAFQGPSYGSPGCFEGHTASFTATLVTGMTFPNSDQLDNMQPFQVFGPVPEPTALTFAGLGVGLFLIRRSKSWRFSTAI